MLSSKNNSKEEIDDLMPTPHLPADMSKANSMQPKAGALIDMEKSRTDPKSAVN